MTKDEIWRVLTAVIREIFDDETLDVRRETTAADVAGWDSIAHVQLLIAVEERLGVRFTTGEAAGLANIGDMADYVERHLEEAR